MTNGSSDERFVRLLTANHNQIQRYIFTLLPHEQDAQDVMQETSLALSQKFADYDQTRPFLPWACGFAYLKVLQHRDRHPQRTDLLPLEALELVAREREDEEPTLAERLVALDRCLAKLGRADRALIQARYIDRISLDEIARRLAVSRRTTFRNLQRVRRLLFDCVGLSTLLGEQGQMIPNHDGANLHGILSAICDEMATADQVERLAERLQTDAAARRFYVRYLDMHARLLALPTLAEPAADGPADRPSRWWPAIWGGAAAAVAIAAFLVGSRVRQRVPAAAAIRPYVATIIEAAPAARLDGRPVALGGRVATGRFHLTRGPCTLRFDGGAQLAFSDGARFEIVSRNAVRIDEAAFTFRGDVTCEAILVTTPRSTLVDVGTEYTAVVTPRSEDIHVIDGVVRRTPSRGNATADLLPARTGRSYVGREAVGRTIEFNPAPAARGAGRSGDEFGKLRAPLAWDRFDTDASRIGGAGGGAGWKDAWIPHDSLPEYAIVRPGLGGPSSGAILHAGAGSAAAHRYLASPIDLGTDGVWYVRYLVRRPATLEQDPNLAMLVLRTWGLTTAEEIERQSDLQLAVYQADTLAVKFAGQSVRSAVPQPPDKTLAFVAKIVAGRTDPDQVFASVFPAGQLSDREPLEWSVATECIASSHVYDQVSVEVVSQGEVLVGDIAIGTTWSSIASGEGTSP